MRSCCNRRARWTALIGTANSDDGTRDPLFRRRDALTERGDLHHHRLPAAAAAHPAATASSHCRTAKILSAHCNSAASPPSNGASARYGKWSTRCSAPTQRSPSCVVTSIASISRTLDVAIGTLYFLTRPHPTQDDLGLLVGLAGRALGD